MYRMDCSTDLLHTCIDLCMFMKQLIQCERNKKADISWSTCVCVCLFFNKYCGDDLSGIWSAFCST